MTDALILAAMVCLYALPWLALTAILEATIWRQPMKGNHMLDHLEELLNRTPSTLPKEYTK